MKLFKIKSEKKILKLVIADFEQAEKRINEKIPYWNEYYDRYLGVEGTRTQEETGSELCSLSIPKTGEKVDWWTAKQLQTIFNYRPIVTIVSRNTDKKTSAGILDELIDYQTFKVPNVRRKLNDQLKDAAIREIGILKTFWNSELHQYDFDVVPIADLYIDPYARYINEARFIIHKFHRTKEALEDSNLYDEKRVKTFVKIAKGLTTETGQVIEQLATENMSLPSSEDGRYEIWEYWTYEGLITVGRYIRKDKKDEKIYAGSYILKKVEKPIVDSEGNGYLPFVAHIFDPKPHEFSGLSLVRQMIDLNDEYDTKRRQMIDATNFAINKQGIVNEQLFSPFTLEKMELNIPGAMYGMKGSGQIGNTYMEIKKGDVPTSIYQEVGLLDKDIENRTGIYQHAQGQEFGRKETATTTVSVLQRADLLSGSQFENYAEDTLKELYYRAIWLNQQFYTKVILSSKFSPDGKTVEYTANDIKGDFDLELNVSAIRGSSEVEFAQILQMYEAYKTDPILMQRYPNLGVLLFKKLLSTRDMIKNAEDMLKESERGMSQTMGGMGQGGMGAGSMPPGFGMSKPGMPTLPNPKPPI